MVASKKMNGCYYIYIIPNYLIRSSPKFIATMRNFSFCWVSLIRYPIQNGLNTCLNYTLGKNTIKITLHYLISKKVKESNNDDSLKKKPLFLQVYINCSKKFFSHLQVCTIYLVNYYIRKLVQEAKLFCAANLKL